MKKESAPAQNLITQMHQTNKKIINQDNYAAAAAAVAAAAAAVAAAEDVTTPGSEDLMEGKVGEEGDESRALKIKMRQEKNRVAAKKCREKKQAFYTSLESSTTQLKDNNRALLVQIELLNVELGRYKSYVETLHQLLQQNGIALPHQPTSVLSMPLMTKVELIGSTDGTDANSIEALTKATTAALTTTITSADIHQQQQQQPAIKKGH